MAILDRRKPSAIVTVRNRKGLHARASAKFVKCAEEFDATVTVTRDGNSVGGTSIMGLMMLAKTIVVVSEHVNVHDLSEVAWRATGNIDPRRDLMIIEGPMDDLDHAALRHRYDPEHPATSALRTSAHDVRLTLDAGLQARLSAIVQDYARRAQGRAAAVVLSGVSCAP